MCGTRQMPWHGNHQTWTCGAKGVADYPPASYARGAGSVHCGCITRIWKGVCRFWCTVTVHPEGDRGRSGQASRKEQGKLVNGAVLLKHKSGWLLLHSFPSCRENARGLPWSVRRSNSSQTPAPGWLTSALVHPLPSRAPCLSLQTSSIHLWAFEPADPLPGKVSLRAAQLTLLSS